MSRWLCPKSIIKSKRSCKELINEKTLQICQFTDKLFYQWTKDCDSMLLKKNYNKARNYTNSVYKKSKVYKYP